jgi:hypothetical protein
MTCDINLILFKLIATTTPVNVGKQKKQESSSSSDSSDDNKKKPSITTKGQQTKKVLK